MADQFDVPFPTANATGPAKTPPVPGATILENLEDRVYEDAIQKLLEHLEQRYADLPSDVRDLIAPLRPQSNILSVYIGEKNEDRVLGGEKCVVVGVRDKYPPGDVPARQLIPAVVPGTSIKTDVVVDDVRVTGSSLSTRYNLPVPCGASVSHSSFTREAGTLGAIVHALQPWSAGGAATQPLQRCILSNNHVIGLLNGAKFDDPILHLGQQVGVFRRFSPLNPSGNQVDAAVAGTNAAAASEVYFGQRLYNGQGPQLTIADPVKDMVVTVFGAASGGPRTGLVTTTSVSFPIPLPGPNGMRTFGFVDLFEIQGVDIGKKGDSGSLVVTRNSSLGLVPLGLYLADNATSGGAATHAYACKIRHVIQDPAIQIQAFC